MGKRSEKPPDKPAKVMSRNVTKALPCKLTDEELLQYGKDVGRAAADRDRIQGEFDSIKQDYKGKLEEQAAIISKLSARLHSGIETRDVVCVETKDWTNATVTIMRHDTCEVVESRPMREDEKQMELKVVTTPDDVTG